MNKKIIKKKTMLFLWLLIFNILLGNSNPIETLKTNILKKEITKDFIKDKEIKPDIVATLIGDEYGNIYFGENINKIHPLASLTKLVTNMVVLDEIKKGTITLDDTIIMTKKIAKIGGSKIKVNIGDELKVSDLMKASIIQSANNATYALAYHAANGDYDLFIKKMNDKMKQLGLENEVKLYTPAGLPDRMTKKKMDVGTIKGMYIIMLEAMKYPEILNFSSMKETTM